MIDQATQQKIKDTADIVDVVGDYVHLIRSGANYKGLCPFHNERTPSFSVNRARNFCFCFSCKKGGSPVNFLMQKLGISYYEALRELAKKYGIKIEEKEITDEEREKMERKESLYVLNEWAMQFFEDYLHNSEEGRNVGLQYLYSRGITPTAIKAFHLGFAPDSYNALREAAKKKGFNLELLKDVGLVASGKKDEAGAVRTYEYELFRGRVIFPIMTSSHKVVGFGGRTLKQEAAKYKNTPETEIYKKSFELYGMGQARQAIVSEKRCFLVEGYLDVISLWQSGVKNVVASSGTALTTEQVALIHRFAENVTLIYDGDSAGIKASLRGIELLLEEGLNVELLLLPDGHDPDSFARNHTPEEVREYIKGHSTDFIRFIASVYSEESRGSSQKRIEAIQNIVRTLALIPDKVTREVYIQECSRIMKISEDTISSSVADAVAVNLNRKRKFRELQKLNRDIDSGKIPPVSSPSSNTSPQSSMHNPDRIRRAPATVNPLKPMEWTVLQYCVKYGFLNFCEALNVNSEDNGTSSNQKQYITVVEYVEDEITNDGLWFSDSEFASLFQLLLDTLPKFKREIEDYRNNLMKEAEQKRKEGYDMIALKNLSINEIQREEAKLEEAINKDMEIKISSFTREYPSRLMASHEEDSIRRLTNEAILEPHQLSQIYSRERPVESEEDKLYMLLPVAITVWKNGILDMRYRELIKELQDVAGKGLPEEERRIQARLSELIKLRSEVAKNIGDRIICPQQGSRL